MKKKSMPIFIIALAISLGALSGQNAANPDAILGEWLNEAGNAKFLIYKSEQKYFGKVTWGTGGSTKDIHNPDPTLRDRDLVGLAILNGFVFSGNQTWTRGTIYDPNNGKTYDCKLTLKRHETLEVRGYVGAPMFGRTETWTRVK
jgi:uncharacterized protein (DUF2147 family)